ncbi:tyrosine-type recombinase/integrase [Goodfellowiella coeruleoviolacea]|uniref:Site-specific recombinase XerD n=1 Tax=Goodfellowiella coeruleoviolacea TaxID=334858 RepID=A0AAE3GH08_9PSEU|nr:site-specific integrase [Goodfellowiella coeruleoviolacea]MCP2168106.1 Site-specific recombinase XerD [Goodfellowiella coeruleoviolacea]
MASTEKLPSGRYRGVYYDASGKKQHTPARDRKRDALNDAREAEVNAKRSAAASRGKLAGHTKWREWYPIWLESRVVEPSTEETELALIEKFILPRWGDEELAKIERDDVQTWVNELSRQGFSAGYVRRIYGPFSASIAAALDKRVLMSSPCVRIRLPGSRKGQPSNRIYARSTLDVVQRAMADEYVFVTNFIAETGLRPAEFGGLHRNSIDRETGWLTVRETYDEVAKRIKAYPKDREWRLIPLTSRALELVDEWERLHPSDRTGCGIPHQRGRCTSDLLFRLKRGQGPLATSTLGAAWGRARRDAGVPDLGPIYGLRHMFATQLAEAGVDAFEIARIMGHADLDQSQDYIHRTAGARLRILSKLGDPAVLLKAVKDDPEQQERATRPTSVPRSSSSAS